MTTEFFDDKPPQPKLAGMTRTRGRRGTSGLSALVAQLPAAAEPQQPPAASPAPKEEEPVAEDVPAPSKNDAPPHSPAQAPAEVVPPSQVAVLPQAETAPPAPPDFVPSNDRPSVEQSLSEVVVPAQPEKATRRAAVAVQQPKSRPLPTRSQEPASLPHNGYQTPEQVSIYVTPAAKEKARGISRAEGIEYAQLAMNAIDHFLREGMLPFLVRARLEVTRPEGSRFPSRRNLRSKSVPGTRRVLWPVQFRPAELDVLTTLVTETGAEHLSTLVSVAVEAYLLDDEDVMKPVRVPT